MCIDTMWSFYVCVHLGITCSLCKRVYPYQLGTSSSDVFGPFFDYMSMDMCHACEWNSWQLTECITHTLVQLTARGIVSLLFFSVVLAAWIAPIPEWGYSWGYRMPTSSFLISLAECSGKLQGRRLSLGLKHFLDGLLHWARAIGGACFSLHKALFPHSSTPPVLP